MKGANGYLRSILAAACVAGAAAACGDRAAIHEADWDVQGPVPLAGHVAYLDRTREEVVTVRAKETATRFAFEVVRQRVGRNPAFLLASADGTRALVVTRGTLGGPGLAEQEERLYRIDPAGREAPVEYSLRSPFDRISLSDDGRWAVAWFGHADAVNPNQMAVVRLDRAGESPTLRALRSYGGRPLSVHLLTDLPVGGVPRQIALTLSENYATMFDLENLQRRDTTIRLIDPRSGASPRVIPEDAVVAKEHVSGSADETPYVFLRAQGVADVYALAIFPSPSAADDQNDFRPVVNQVSVAGVPEDFVVFTRAGAGGERPQVRLLVVAGSGWRSSVVSIVDPRTANRWDVPLETSATRVLLFAFTDRAGNARKIAFLWDATRGGVETRGSFLDLENVETRRTLNLEVLDLGSTVDAVIPTANPVKLLLVHGGISRVSVLNVAERTVDRIGTMVSVDLSAMHPDGTALFFAGTGTASSRISALDLEVRHAQDVRLDAPVNRLLALPGDPDLRTRDGRALLVDHGWASGYVTALPLDQPHRARASSIQGFLAQGALDIDTEHYEGTEVAP